MITLHYTPKEEYSEEVPQKIHVVKFKTSNELFAFCCAELHADDEFVYLLAIGDDAESCIFIDHVTGNILGFLAQMTDGIIEETVFLFLEASYEDAYKLATDMKEETGLAYSWQKPDSAIQEIINLQLSNKN